ncbi:MAG: hypothetical protein ALAOOOJD_04055 [bacterium]|nr:hypothetical protein [bacterium]
MFGAQQVVHQRAFDVEKAIFFHPLVGVKFREVIFAGVGQNHHHDFVGRQLARDFQGDIRGAAGGAADEQAFLAGETARHQKRFLVTDGINFVDIFPVQRAGNDFLADTLDFIRLSVQQIFCIEMLAQGRAGRIGADHFDGRIFFFEILRRAGNRAAGADAADKIIELAFGLFPNFRAGGAIMRRGVFGIVILIGENRIRGFLHDFGGDAVIAFRRVVRHGGWANHHFGAIRFEHAHFFLAHFVGHRKNRAIAFDGCGERQAGAGVAAGGFDNGAAGLEPAGFFSVFEHREGNAIFDAAAGIEIFHFRINGGLEAGGDAIQTHQRRVADGFRNVAKNLFHLLFLTRQ